MGSRGLRPGPGLAVGQRPQRQEGDARKGKAATESIFKGKKDLGIKMLRDSPILLSSFVFCFIFEANG